MQYIHEAIMDESTIGWLQHLIDFDGNGKITVADVGNWLMEILLLPGNGFISLLLNHAPAVADFFELNDSHYDGAVAMWLSALIWLAGIVLGGAIVSFVREIDNRATAWIRRRYLDLKSRLSALRRRLVSGISARWRSRSSNNGFSVDMITLANTETLVLRCLSTIDDGAVMTLDEIAARLDRPRREVRTLVKKLTDLEFVEIGADKYLKKKGHRIATAGQMYLLGS